MAGFETGTKIEILRASADGFPVRWAILLGCGKFPLRIVDGDAVAVAFLSDGESCQRFVEGCRWVTLYPFIAAQRLCLDSFFLDDDLCTHSAREFLAVNAGYRHTHHQPVLLRHQIALPATPHDGVTLAHEKAVAGILDGAGIVALGRVVQECNDALAAAIGGIVENFSIAPGHVERFQNTEIAPVLDFAASVSRRFVQVDDDLVQPIFWIDLAVNLADKFFVGTSNGEFMSPGKDLSSFNNESRDHDGPLAHRCKAVEHLGRHGVNSSLRNQGAWMKHILGIEFTSGEALVMAVFE